MIPVQLPSASGMKPLHFTLLTIAMAILALVYVTYLAARWTGYWESDVVWMSAPQQRSVRIADASFTVPDTLMRSPGQGLSFLTGTETVSSLNLAVVWPSMKGFRATGNRSAERPGSNLILIDIAAGAEEVMRDRLVTVYKRLARGEEKAGPAGLKVLTLSSAVALETDQVVFEPGRETGFIARCRQPKGEVSICSRDMRLDEDLTITYRFDRKLLANWGRLDRRITQLVTALQQ